MNTLNNSDMEVKYIIINVGLGIKQIRKCICYKNNNLKYKPVTIIGEKEIYYANVKYLFGSEIEAIEYLNNEE